jgi:hypothetical protein
MVSNNSGNYLHRVRGAPIIEYGKFSVIRQLSCTPRAQIPHWDIPSENIMSFPSLRVTPDVQIMESLPKSYNNKPGNMDRKRVMLVVLPGDLSA